VSWIHILMAQGAGEGVQPDRPDLATPWLHNLEKQKASPREAGLSA